MMSTIPEELERLASFPRLNPNAVIEVDYSGKITYSNPAVEKALESLNLGKGDATSFLPEDLDVILKNIGKENESFFHREVVIKDRIFEEAISLMPQLKVVRIYAHDITEHRKVEKALKEAQRVAHIGSWDWDAAADTIWWSDGYYGVFNLDTRVPPPNYQDHLKVYTPESAGRLDAAVKKAMQTGEPYELDLEIADPAGPIRWISARGEAKRDPDGRIVGLRGTAQNITERVRTEQELKESALRLQLTLRAANIGLWDWDLRTDKVHYSPGWKRQIGYEDSEITDHFSEWQKRVHPEDLDRAIKTIRAFIEKPWPDYRLEFRLRHKDGSYRWILTQASIMHDGQGKPIRMLGSHIDITERKRKEEELMISRQRLSLHVQQTPLAVIEFDIGGRIRGWNPAAVKMFGFSQEEAVGQHWKIIVPETVWRSLDGVWEELVKRRGGARSTNENRTKDGKAIYCEWFSTPLIDQEGNTIGVASLVMDITDRRKTDLMLKTREHQLAESERIAHIGSWEHNLSTGEIRWSDELFRLLGLDPETNEPDFNMFFEMIHPEDRPALKRATEETVRLQKPFSLDYRFILSDGSTRILHAQAELVHDTFSGQPVLRGTCQDITESKRLEMEREEYYRLFQSSSDLMCIANPNGAFKKTNPACSSTLGYSEAELVARPFVEFVHPDDRQRTLEEMAGQLQRGFSLNFENRYLCKDGSVRWLSWRATYDKDEQLTYATARDITEMKLAGEALRRANAYNRILIEASLDPLVTIGRDGKITDVNAATEAVTGVARSELIGTDFSSYFTEPEKAREGYKQVFLSGAVRDYPLDIEHRDGTITSVLYNASVYKDDAGNVIGVFAAARDITERKKTEDALQKSEAFIKNILETVDEGFIVVDRGYRILSANRAFYDSSHLTAGEVLGRSCHEVSHNIDKPCFKSGEECPVRRTFETGEPSGASHTHTDEDGTRRYVEIRAFPVRDAIGNVVSAIETINDITERKHLEEQLRHAQKLESLGTLAGGVAHDFNNILNVIVGYGGMMEMRMKKDDPNVPYIREILAASERATHLTQALLIFSRKQIAEMRPVSIGELIEGMRKMILRLIGEDIETNIFPVPDRLTVLGDHGQLEQVLMNLATNARDAMPDGGSLSIHTQPYEMDNEFIDVHGFGKPGEYVLISVSDTGEGMDEKARERIFEPFFTTKGVGKGTGLGLSIVYGIVKQHNGYINCYSEPGRGTTFRVYLPLVRDELFDAQKHVSGPVKGGKETILIADDDENIRRFTKNLLEEFGYTVVEARDGADAVEKFRENRERINLVLLDVIMPRKSGREAFDEIRGMHPGIKILFISGYTEDIIQRKRILEDKLPLLQKPAAPKELLAKVREILDMKK